jgi:hypothetical protein
VGGWPCSKGDFHPSRSAKLLDTVTVELDLLGSTIISSEKLRMTSCTIKNKFILLYGVNQNPIRFDMAITLVLIFAAEGMIMVFRR